MMGVATADVDHDLLKKAKSRALFLLDRMDYTSFRMRQKLRQGAYPEAVIDKTLEYLTERKYIDDDRYASLYVHSHKDAMPERMLRKKMKERGLPGEVISRALEEADLPDESILIEKYLKKKHYDPSSADPRDRQKIMRFLISKGFSYDSIL